jgi:cysteinyl-tRNA synthetase
LVAGAWLLGLLTETPEAHFKAGTSVDAAHIEERIAARNAARAARDFRQADEIRDELLAQGIELEDTRDGTRWRTRS